MPSKSYKKSKKSSKKLTPKRKTPKSQKGGSPASSLVMDSTTGAPVMNDYIAFPRIRDGTSGSSGSGCMTGGSTASDMVMSNLTDNAQTDAYLQGFDVKGDINSLNTYKLTGGLRKRRGSKGHKGKKSRTSKKFDKSKKNKSRKHKNNNHKHMMRGGHASDWISSQYSLGNINNASMNSSTGDFSASQGVDRNTIMNPPTLGLAGSGYPMGSLEGANVNSVGAPLV